MDKEKNEQEKLNILQVHNYYRIAGGEDQVVSNEGELLRKHGHKVWLYARRNEEIEGMKLWEKVCLPATAVFSLKTWREVRDLIREKKIDLVHVHNTLPLISPSVFYAAFAAGVPVVMTVHNFRLLCPEGTCYRNGHVCEECVKSGLLRSVKYGCYRGSRVQTLICATSMGIHRMLKTYSRIHYICLTEFNKNKLLQLKQIDENKVFIKANFMDCPKEMPTASQKSNYMLYAGRLEENKGIKVLLRAYRELANDNQIADEEIPELVICGEGSLEKKCRQYVKRHRLHKVSFRGRVPYEEVKQLMAMAGGIVVPSLWYEGFPMNVAEGCSLRTPVIGSDRGNVGGLIRDGVNGLKFEAGNAKSLAKAIMECGRTEFSFEFPGIEEWMEEGNYQKLMEIYERCMEHVWKNKEK